MLDQNGNLVGVVSAKLDALKLMVATNGDIAQNVNFAIKSSIVASFLDANGVGYATGARPSRCNRRTWPTRQRESVSMSNASRSDKDLNPSPKDSARPDQKRSSPLMPIAS